MDIELIIEAVSVIAGLAYLYLIIREKRIAWLLGVFSSILAIYLFLIGKLYSEATLYSFYVITGIYGYVHWGKDSSAIVIQEAKAKQVLGLILIAIAGSFTLGWFFQKTSDADMPYFDASTSIFSFLATWMSTQKILQNWLFWVLIDAASIVLYSIKELYLLAGLMAVYTVIAVYGYLNWRKKYEISIRN